MSEELYDINFEDDDMLNEEAEATRKFLTFGSDNLEYAIDADYVNEIIMSNSITRIPRLPNFIYGVINLRGQVIPIIDVRLRMGRTKTEFTDDTCIIVANINEVPIGLLVDHVSQMVDVGESQINTPPVNKNQDLVDGIARVNGQVLLLINAEELIRK